jgi:general secretion pathway protein A
MMYSLTPGIETYAAYATCMILFGLLVLSVRFRKMAARTSPSLYGSSLFGRSRRAPRYESRPSLRSAATPVKRSARVATSSLEQAPPACSKPKVSESSASPMVAPENAPALPIPNEVRMNSASFPFENLDPIAWSEISENALPATASEASALIPATLAMLTPTEIGDQVAQVSQISNISPAREANAPEPTVAEGAVRAEKNACEDKFIDWPESSVAVSREKTATDVLTCYGLPQQPFDVTPDPAYLYLSPSHREALASLKDGIEHFRGFMVLVAEPGMGKTTLLHKLMEEVTDSARVVFLFQTQCTSRELLCSILNELEVDHTGMDVVAMHRALNQALLEEMLRGRRFVLVVDEAQNLQEPVLETIRLLSDFETTHSKLIQIVLAGQPQMAETLMRPSLVQLRQRIAVLSSLKSLTPMETAEYIEHRLRAAGWKDNLLFSSDALDQIAQSSQGVPRSINNLCFNSLLGAFHRGYEFVDAGVVKEVADKLNLEGLVRPLQGSAASQQACAPVESVDASELARALAAALSAETRPDSNSGNGNATKSKPEVVLTGNLTEKVRSQGWSKRHEYRIMVTLERDPVSGLPVADRYYCCSIYMDEPQAAGLEPGKPVRIKIEQD